MAYYKAESFALHTVRRARKRRRCDGRGMNPDCPYFIEKGELYTRSACPPGGEMGFLSWATQYLCTQCLEIPEEKLK